MILNILFNLYISDKMKVQEKRKQLFIKRAKDYLYKRKKGANLKHTL